MNQANNEADRPLKWVELGEGAYKACTGKELLVYGVVRVKCCGDHPAHSCYEKLPS